MDWSGEGAAAVGGDGEAQQVGDRSRTDDRDPVPANVRVVERIPHRGVGVVPDEGIHGGSGPHRGPDRIVRKESGGVRRWRGLPRFDGRTNIGRREGSGPRREGRRGSHAYEISNDIK